MAKHFLTRFAFPGVPNRDAPTELIRQLRRTSSPGEIEYIPLITEGSTIVVFVSHGRLRALDQLGVGQWETLAEKQGISVVLHNYPGYGGTPGPITEARLCEDALQLVEYIMIQPWAQGQELVLLGNSVGCGPTMWLATQKTLGVKRVALVSAYTSICALVPFWVLSYAAKMLGVKISPASAMWLGSPERLAGLQGSSWDPFPPVKLAKELVGGVQVLLLHGGIDSTVPVSHSKALLKELQGVEGVTATLCVIPDTEHRHTRVRGDEAIWSFFRGDLEELERVIAELADVGAAGAENVVGAD